MSAVQEVSNYINDNQQVVRTDVGYTVDKSHDVVISKSVFPITLILPQNPEIGESHRFIAPNLNAASTIILNGGANGITRGAITSFTKLVPVGTLVDVTWTGGPSGWVTTCCAEEVYQPG